MSLRSTRQATTFCTASLPQYEAIDNDKEDSISLPGFGPQAEQSGAPNLAVLPPLPPAHHFNVDRVTFTHPHRIRSTPFDRYKASCAPAPGPDSLFFAARRLGLEKEVLEASVNQEIEELLAEIEASRRQDLLERLPCEQRLSQAECLQMFRNGDLVPTGSLAGVYCWASGLDTDALPDVRD